MKEIIFACPWGKNRKRAWSGTYYGLYTELKKLYKIIDFDLSYESESGNPYVMFYKFREKALSKLRRNDFSMGKNKCFDRIAKNRFEKSGKACVQFSECPCVEGVSSYIYQDLSVGYLKKLKDENPELFQYCGFNNIRKREIEKREQIQRKAYTGASAVFTMGKWLQKELIENYGLSEEIVFHAGGGYNIDPLKIDASQKMGNKILFVGRDFERKNGPLVIEAFQLAKKERPDLELYIAGPKNLSIHADGIVCLGDLNSEELIEYFNKCDIFCMPSRFEAYGLVFPEALTFGLPCIGRDAYEMPYFIEDGVTGYLLKNQSAEELSRLMLNCISNAEMKENVIRKRDWYIKEYSWETVVRRMQTVIEEKQQWDK